MTALAMHPRPPLRVIVVDDEPLAREDVVQLLGGRTDVDIVATCANGHEAIEAVRRLRPDVLLLDIRMPGLTGTEAMRVFRVATTAAFLAYCLPYYVESVWHAHPWGVTLKNMFGGLLYALAAGAVFAWLWPG